MKASDVQHCSELGIILLIQILNNAEHQILLELEMSCCACERELYNLYDDAIQHGERNGHRANDIDLQCNVFRFPLYS